MADTNLLFLSVSIILLIITVLLALWVMKLRNEMSEISFRKSSQSVKYGKLTEQWIPFSKDFPYEPSRFRFLGNPIDGIVFDEDEIIFTEIKTSSSQLNPTQKRIRDLVKQGKVKWHEFRIK